MVTFRHLSFAKVLAGGDDQNDQGQDRGAQSRHLNPSGGGVRGEGDCVETQWRFGRMKRWGLESRWVLERVSGAAGQRPVWSLLSPEHPV